MKRLYILRHSKAGHSNKKILDDHERTLTDKGIEYCRSIAHYFKNTPLPDEIISSSAVRARQTIESVIHNLNSDAPVNIVNNLYLADVPVLFNVIQQIDESADSAIIIGHNPGLQQFCIQLAGKGDKKKFRNMRNNFPPPSLAVFDLDIESWFDVDVQRGELIDFVTARELVT